MDLDFSSEPGIVNATLWLLACFSLLTWSVILLKLGEWGVSTYRNFFFTRNIWNTSEQPVRIILDSAKVKSQLARIYQSGQKVLAKIPSQQVLRIDQYTAWHELIERALKQQIQKEKAVMESGLGWLASFGSTSPFVGLFGTVWGIMNALQDISSKGSASLEVVAGPIGEALVATGIGIAVAVPAVLGYNFFIRLNRGTTAKLEHFADDFLQTIIQDHLQQQSVTTHGNANPK
ncbi:MAG: MotA/TolQ/ExbB proton channel family protein [Methyloglobulus sp.]